MGHVHPHCCWAAFRLGWRAACRPAPWLAPHAACLPAASSQIRVADDGGEWTVSRRYRNFEVLHRQLRAYVAYRLKLPPKRIFIHSNK